MNTYKRYCPNVFVAQCDEKHKKGDIIILTTKYGNEHECEVHNFLGNTKVGEDTKYLYSITRTDGFNAQERASRKAEKLSGYASNARQRSEVAYKKANMSESATGIPFGQPILVGHHSEGAHRRTIKRADNAMRKSIEEDDKAKKYDSRRVYWERMAKKINLSMPESLEFFRMQYDEAVEHHKKLRDGTIARSHSYSLAYAKKRVNELKGKCTTANKLWGDRDEQI